MTKRPVNGSRAETDIASALTGPGFPPGSVSVIQAAMRAVPATKYALGIAGVGASTAIVLGLLGSPVAAVIGVSGGLAFSIILLVFANLAKQKPDTFHRPALIVLWSATLLFVATLVGLLSSFFFAVPLDLRPGRTVQVSETVPMNSDLSPVLTSSRARSNASAVPSFEANQTRSREIARKLRRALASRFRESGWILTDPNDPSIEPWTQAEALVALTAAKPDDVTSSMELKKAYAVLYERRSARGWRTDLLPYFHVEIPLYATWSFCTGRLRNVAVDAAAIEHSWKIATRYSDELGRWKEVPGHIDTPSIYATSLALVTMLECGKVRSFAASSNAKARVQMAISWLTTNNAAKDGLPAWKAEPAAIAPMLGVTLLTTYGLMRAKRDLNVDIPIDFRTTMARVLQGAAHTSSDFAAHDTYVYVAGNATSPRISHSVRFLRNPWAIACAAEWLRQYGESGNSSDVRTVLRIWGHLLDVVEGADLAGAQSFQIADYLTTLNLSAF